MFVTVGLAAEDLLNSDSVVVASSEKVKGDVSMGSSGHGSVGGGVMHSGGGMSGMHSGGMSGGPVHGGGPAMQGGAPNVQGGGGPNRGPGPNVQGGGGPNRVGGGQQGQNYPRVQPRMEGHEHHEHEHHGYAWWPWNWRFWGEPEYPSSDQYIYPAQPGQQYTAIQQQGEYYQYAVDLRYFFWPLIILFIVIVILLVAIYRKLNKREKK